MEDNNNHNQASREGQSAVSPDQMSMFQEEVPEVTHLDIPHQVLMEEANSIDTTPPTIETELEADTDEVSGTKKIKIIAALAIVAAAGYIAYWVQEPVQIKADVVSSESLSDASTTSTSTPDNSPASESDKLVADSAPLETTSPSVNVDVSLFGFEPSTLKLDKGTTVIWTNTSTEDQTIVGSSEDGQSFVSPVLSSGDSFSYQFDQDATFQYYSTYNPALKASITVGLGALPADTTLPTDDMDEAMNTTPGNASTSPITTAPPTAGSALEEGIDQTKTMSTTTESETAVTPAPAEKDLKPAADETPSKLAKTGPEDLLYLLFVLVIGWFNRKTLLKAFRKY